MVFRVLTGSSLEPPSILNMIAANPVIRSKINLHMPASRSIFLFIEFSFCEDPSGHKSILRY
jgi:hypothetical protein